MFTDERQACPSLEKRHGFQKILRLCRKGEIDLILTRSLTTFSQTVYDAMKTIRELQALNIPVISEKEELNTSSPDTETLFNLYAAFAKAESEFLLTLYGASAQSESEGISKNVSWCKQQAMKDGKVGGNARWPFLYPFSDGTASVCFCP